MRDTPVNNAVLVAQQELFGWVPFEFWAKVAPGETREKARTRIKEGKWQLGLHCHRPSPKELWIHLRNAQAWVEGREPEADAPPRTEWVKPKDSLKVIDRPID